MNIAILIGSLCSGGAERVSVSLSRYLVDQGHRTTLITMHGSDRDFYVLDSRVTRVCLNLAGTNRGIHKILANINRVRALRHQLKTRRIDVVVGMMSSAAIYAILASIALPTRVIASERNFPGRKRIPAIWNILRRITYRFADAHVVQTKEAADWVGKNTASKNIHTIPNSVSWPIPSYEPVVHPEDVLPAERSFVLAVGSQVHQKGFDLLIDAFARVAHKHWDWDLVILGLEEPEEVENDDTEQLKRAMYETGIRDRVYLPGRVGNVGDWYERAEVFVLSSRYEGFPNVLLEAMASGCACIAYDCDTGPRDVIANYLDGILVPPENVLKLADAICKLISDRSLRQKIGEKASAVSDRYSEQEVFGLWCQVFHKVVRNGRG